MQWTASFNHHSAAYVHDGRRARRKPKTLLQKIGAFFSFLIVAAAAYVAVIIAVFQFAAMIRS